MFVGIVAVLVVGAILLSFPLAYAFMLIWNFAVVGALDFANPVDFWHAYWLMCFFLFFVRASSGVSAKGKD